MTGAHPDAPSGPTSTRADASRGATGDRGCALRVLLPADLAAGRVVLGVGEALSTSLRLLLPDALVLRDRVTTDASSPDAGSASLVVVDARRHDVDALRPLLAPGGVLAVLGRGGPYVVYPDELRPEMIWRAGWPVARAVAPTARLRRRVGLVVRRSAPRLRLEGPATASLADEVLADVAACTGTPGRLVGVVTAERTVLRMRTRDGDVAVRLSLVATGPGQGHDAVAEEVEGIRPFLARELARGSTRGHPWAATVWARGPSPTWTPGVRRRAVWRTAEQVVDVLDAHPTGTTTPGWAERWCDDAELVPADVRRSWARTMGVLDERVPTTWCHGDLWSGNVVQDGRRPVVLDWDNASRDAPAGLDRLLIPALRAASDGDRRPPEVVLALVDAYDGRGDVLVGGRRWDEWDRPHRVALALAAVVLHLRNRSPSSLSSHDLERHVAEVERTVAGPPRSDAPRPGSTDDATLPRGTRAVRGAAWLGANALVVKAAQTVVLLTLAALLAPEALGLIALGAVVANVCVVLAGLGTASALVRWRGDAERAARTAVTLAAGTGALLAATTWVGAPWLAEVLGATSEAVPVIRGLTATVPLLAVAAVTNELLRRRTAFLRRIVPDASAAVVGAVVAIVLATAGQGVTAFVVGQVVQAVVTLGLAWCVHPVVRPGWDRRDARRLLGHGSPLAGAQLLQLVQLNVDYVIVSVVLGAVALGQYSLAFRIAFLPYLLVAVVVAGAALPYLSTLSPARRARAVGEVLTLTLTVLTPLCLGLLVLSEHLTLLGPEWAGGVPVLALLAVYAWLLGASQVVQGALNAAGRPALSLALRASHLLVLTGTLSVVVGRGLVAVALTQVVVAALAAALALVVARVALRGLSLRALAGGLRPAAWGAAVMLTAMLVVRWLFDDRTGEPAVLLATGAVGVVTYVVTVARLDHVDGSRLVRLVRSDR